MTIAHLINYRAITTGMFFWLVLTAQINFALHIGLTAPSVAARGFIIALAAGVTMFLDLVERRAHRTHDHREQLRRLASPTEGGFCMFLPTWLWLGMLHAVGLLMMA